MVLEYQEKEIEVERMRLELQALRERLRGLNGKVRAQETDSQFFEGGPSNYPI